MVTERRFGTSRVTLVEGDITGWAVVTASGRLHGKIRVEQLTSEGQVSGDIEAHTLKLSGQVNDQTRIRAQTLEVRLDSAGGEEPADPAENDDSED